MLCLSNARVTDTYRRPTDKRRSPFFHKPKYYWEAITTAKLKLFSGTPVAEGVRLEVGKHTVFAVRNEDGEISVRMRKEPRKLLQHMLHIPLLRGIVRLFHGLHRFFDGLSESSELKPQHIEKCCAAETFVARFLHIYPQTLAAWGSAIAIAVLAFLLLWAAPTGADQLLSDFTTLNATLLALIGCLVRMLCLLFAVGLCGRLRVFRRLLRYRCAINQVINCYECRDEINLDNVRAYPRYARRSDSAFFLVTLLVSQVFFALTGVRGTLITVVVRACVILLTAALINEPILAMEQAELTAAVRVVRTPYDLLQRLTTRLADVAESEVAICAFKAALGQFAQEEKENEHRGLDTERDRSA